MDDAMIDLMAGDAMLRRRLEAFAEARLSPDQAASSRIRARVLAVAHRRAALARADAGLAVVPEAGSTAVTGRRIVARRAPAAWRRGAAVILAASLALSVAVGTMFAAQPGGPLYGARLWAETLQLPSDPSARAVAELDRLQHRLDEVAAANRAGDAAAAAAALSAYAAILDVASSRAILDDDAVASAALEAGVARNVEVLRGLLSMLPDEGAAAVTLALERAIDRSDEALDAIGGPGVDKPAGGDQQGGGGGTGGQPAKPTAAPDATDQPPATPTPKPTKSPAVKPTKQPTPEPAVAPTPAPTAAPTRTPRPERTPPAHGKASEPPGGGGSGPGGG